MFWTSTFHIDVPSSEMIPIQDSTSSGGCFVGQRLTRRLRNFALLRCLVVKCRRRPINIVHVS